MASPHPVSCARKLIRDADGNGWSRAQLAEAIHDHCGHSRLRSHRLAHGWTLEDAVQKVVMEFKSQNGTPCGLNTSRVSKWERGEEDPGKKYLTALCRVFHSDPLTLGIVAGIPEEEHDTAAVVPPSHHGVSHQAPQVLPFGGRTEPRIQTVRDCPSEWRSLTVNVGATPPASLSETIGNLRRKLDQTLSATNISDSTVDHWQSVADSYGRTYRTSPPVPFLITIAQDIAELRLLTDQRLPTAQRRGLCHATARMAGLLATTLINLGDHREARGWFHTAQRAADESEDPAIRAWVLVRHAVSALYWDDAHAALQLATQAALVARHAPCAAAAWAPAVQARALAQLGQSEATRAAIGRAEDAFTKLETQPQEQHAYGYTAAQLHFYRSNALTAIRDTEPAYQAQNAALDHYGPNAFLDPSLVRMDQAIFLAYDGEIDEAAHFASRSLMALPQEHRSPIVMMRARELTTAIPAARRALPAVREFHEVLALGAPA